MGVGRLIPQGSNRGRCDCDVGGAVIKYQLKMEHYTMRIVNLYNDEVENEKYSCCSLCIDICLRGIGSGSYP